MKIVFRVLGIPVFTVDVSDVSPFLTEEVDYHIEGGSAHNFERDVCPLTPEDRYEWEWEDKGGFGFAP